MPGGNATDPGCLSKAANCSAQHALDVARANDEVIFTAGNYYADSGLVQNANVPQNVHGEDGQPPPWIVANDPNAFAFASCFCRQDRAAIRHLNFENDGGGGGLFFTGGTNDFPTAIEDVQALGGDRGMTSFFFNAVARNSTAYALGTGGIAFDSYANMNVLGVTAVAAAAGGVGFQQNPACFFGSCIRGPTVATILYSVLTGGAGGADVRTTSESCGPGCLAYGEVFRIGFSNFRTVSNCAGCAFTQGPGNQSAAPVFVNRQGGDLHQAPGSPTVDAGQDSPSSGATDIDGDPRKVGPAPDIGADELVPNQAPPPLGLPRPLRARGAQTPLPLQAFPGLRLGAVLLAVRGGSFVARVPCPSLVTGRCKGTIVFRTPGKRRIGGASFSIRRGKTKHVRVELSKRARRMLVAKSRLQAVARLKARANGTTKTTTVDVTLERKKNHG